MIKQLSEKINNVYFSCNRYRNLCIKLLTNEMPYKGVTSIACIRTKRIICLLSKRTLYDELGTFASL